MARTKVLLVEALQARFPEQQRFLERLVAPGCRLGGGLLDQLGCGPTRNSARLVWPIATRQEEKSIHITGTWPLLMESRVKLSQRMPRVVAAYELPHVVEVLKETEAGVIGSREYRCSISTNKNRLIAIQRLDDAAQNFQLMPLHVALYEANARLAVSEHIV